MKERIFRCILAAGAALVLSAALIFFPSCTGAGSDTPGSATAAPESSRVLIRPEPKPEPEAATLVLEALATESYRTLRKTVFEVCYRHTYGAKSDALNVFELMIDTARCDPGIFANGYSDEAAAASIRALRGGSLSSYNAARHNGYWDSFAAAIKKAAGEELTGG